MEKNKLNTENQRQTNINRFNNEKEKKRHFKAHK